MSSLLAIVPVLRRPHRVLPLWKSWKASLRNLAEKPSTDIFDPMHLVFVVQEDDAEELNTLIKECIPYIQVPSNCSRWSQKINFVVRKYSQHSYYGWYWFAADDLEFQPNWSSNLSVFLRGFANSAGGPVLHRDGSSPWVIGSSDGANPSTMSGQTSTHPIVSRGYIDTYGQPLFEGYRHNFVDAEFVAVAQHRKKYVHMSSVLAKHLHPVWGTAPNDDTYRLGKSHFAEDKALFLARRAAGGW